MGRIRVTDSRFRADMYPPDTSCSCYTCQNFTRAYLHHLFHIKEILGATLATIHNLAWFCGYMERMRASIVDGTFPAFRAAAHEIWDRKD